MTLHEGGRALLRRVLGIQEEELRFAPGGKPWVPGKPAFNLSHSGRLVLLAVSGAGEIGCDVEDSARNLRNPERLRRKIAGPGEDGEPVLALWVKKEAQYKSGLPGGAAFSFSLPGGYLAAVCCEALPDPIPTPERILL
jgi:phosphopantetheinyl transferase